MRHALPQSLNSVSSKRLMCTGSNFLIQSFAFVTSRTVALWAKIDWLRLACPEQGSFTAYKKVYYDGGPVIVELRVPANAKRSSATSNKCRCSKAKVISFTTLDGEPIDVTQITNRELRPQIYEIGKVVKPDSFDQCRWNECSNGIHFFINRKKR